MYDVTTTNFADFGLRERRMAAELLNASCDHGFPDGFVDDGVQIVFNRSSGKVFFTNAECQVCMMNGRNLEFFYTTPYHGHEGFADELLALFENDGNSWNRDDVEYLHDLGILSDEAWDAYENGTNHADGGCCSEPVCPVCRTECVNVLSYAPFMQGQIKKGLWLAIHTDGPTWFIPQEFSPSGITLQVGETTNAATLPAKVLNELLQYTDGDEVVRGVSLHDGYGVRMSAPGYLDSTAWEFYADLADAEARCKELEEE